MLTSTRYWLVKSIMRCGGFALSRYITRSFPTILMYHRFAATSTRKAIGVEDFARHLRYLNSHFHLTSLAGCVEDLKSGRPPKENTAVITVDDGYADFKEFAQPVLRKHGISATVFLTTGFVDGRMWLWPDVVSYVLENARSDVSGVLHRTGIRMTSGQSPWQGIVDVATSLPDDARRSLLCEIAAGCEVTIPARPDSSCAPLSWEDVRWLSEQGIEFGAHSVSHPIMSRLSDEQIVREVVDSKTRIEEMTGLRVNLFCYPNGMPEDVDDRVTSAVREAGYDAGVVAYPTSGRTVDMFRIGRVSANASDYEFRKAANGVHWLKARV